MKRFGTKYGGFTYPSDLPGLNKNSVIWCVGVGEDISHDVQVAKVTGAYIYLFDPTPRALEHIRTVKRVLGFPKEALPSPNKRNGGGDATYFSNIRKNQVSPSKLIALDFGIGPTNGLVKFYKPTNPEYVSHSISSVGRSKEHIIVEMKTLGEAMKCLNQDHIDLLKIDIEGAECDVLDEMLRMPNVRPQYLSVDFDLARVNNNGAEKCKLMCKRLGDCGYEIIHFDNWDVSFHFKK